MLIDRCQRTINYLRISITDLCNYRCVYCMPPEGIQRREHRDILSFEEITQFTTVAAAEGITRVRLTGGEPLVRRGVSTLIRMLHAVPGLEEISLTTNAHLLDKFAPDLAEAGLKRINVSLDTLKKDKFKAITRGGSLEQVWRGIEAAERAGLAPIKLNAVVVRGVNDDELIDLARLSLDHPWSVRFIELMPVGNQQSWGDEFPNADGRYYSVQEMKEQLMPLRLEPVEKDRQGGPVSEYAIPGAAGTIGFISPLGEHFCERCNRLRLTADGKLRPCLLNDTEISIRDALRNGEDLRPYLHAAILAKPVGHELDAQIYPQARKMAEIGG
jgi:GTP 3',8-cyclase